MALILTTPWEKWTIPGMFAESVAVRPDHVALMYKDYGIWQQVTWREYGERAQAVGMGLAQLGLKPRECVAILAETRHEWLYADMGAQGIGCVAVGLYPTSSRDQAEYILNDCQARAIFVEDEEQLDKVLERLDKLPHIQHIIVMDMDGLKAFAHDAVISFEQLMASGAAYAKANPDAWARSLQIAQPEDDAILVYTSGTTGAPKGARLTHRNLAYQSAVWFAPTGNDDHTVAFLPLCHVAERLNSAIRPLAYGGVVNFVESPDTVFENLREISPTVFIGVPRTWEKLYSTTVMALQDATPLQRWIYRQAISVGEAVADCKLGRRRVPLGLKLKRTIAEWLALGNTKRMLGLGRCRLIGSGAAPISPEAIRWYLALGLDMVELYGQTECGGIATVYPPDGIQLGTVGPVIPGTEVRIAEDGEILIRSPGVFPGYRNRPEKNAEALRDGWLHTGDIGSMAADGYLRITDRKSDIMITSGGKNITPTEIENKLKFSPYITDAIVIGDRRKFLTCLVMIDHDIVAKYIQDKRIPFTDYASLTRLPEVRKLIGGEIEKTNASLNNVESIKKFELIEVLLTAEDEEMTPTLKLRRKYVNEKYRDLIESMYRGPG